jgi:hypothetical protein
MFEIFIGNPLNAQSCLQANVTGYADSANNLAFAGTLHSTPSIVSAFTCPQSVLSLSGQNVTFFANYSNSDVLMTISNVPEALNFTGTASTFLVT